MGGEGAEHGDAGCHAEDAVVASACRLRVKVGAGEGGWARAAAGADGELVAHFVHGESAAEGLGCSGEPVARELVCVGEGEA